MNNTTNIIFAFLGGVAVGALATVGVMKKTGKIEPRVVEVSGGDPVHVPNGGTGGSELPEADKPSFSQTKTINTEKTSYNALRQKPDLAELAKKYEDEAVVKEAAERESPEEGDDEEEEEDEETALQNEIGEALMRHPGCEDDMILEEPEGYGHVIQQLDTGRRDQLVYLIPEDYAGEVYVLEDLTYYSGDDILCDVTDTPINDVMGVVGGALDCFGEGSSDPDKVFVRNCHNGFEYEIKRVDGYFGAKIYGVSDEDMAAISKKGAKKVKSKKEED